MCLLLSVDVHKPYMPLEFFTHRDFVMKLYNRAYKSVILGKLNTQYAVSAWWGCSSAADRQHLQALLHRGIRSGLCSPETPSLTELAESIDDKLFQRILHNPYHVIYHLLPPRRELSYNIRQRHHDRQLNIISGQLRSRNFIYRMLFKDCYWLFLYPLFLYSPSIACVLEQMRSVISV